MRVTKRKRGGFEEETTDSGAEYDTSTITNGEIEILEDDLEERFIRLHNISSKVRIKRTTVLRHVWYKKRHQEFIESNVSNFVGGIHLWLAVDSFVR